MKGLVKTREGPGNVVWTDWPDPSIRDDQVLVEILRTGICSTDLAVLDWTYRPRRPVLVPSILGHEAAGRVVAVGDRVEDVEIGNNVALQVIWGHHHARESLLGSENLDPDWHHLGTSDLGGAFAELIAIDAAHVVRLPSSVSLEDGALLEPAAVAAHAMELVSLAAGEKVCLVGPGPFGLIMSQIAKSSGASRIVAVGLPGVDGARLEVGRRAAGIDDVVLREGDLVATAEGVRQALGAAGADVVLDCGGTSDSLPLALEVAAHGGRVAVFGFAHHAEIEPFRHIVRKGLRLSGVSAAARRHYGIALRLISEHAISPSAIVTHTLPMSEAVAGMSLVRSRIATKVALLPPGRTNGE